jgi:hypothetical protein
MSHGPRISKCGDAECYQRRAVRQPSFARTALFRRPSLETIHTGRKCANLPLQLADLMLQSTYGLALIVLGNC